MQLSKNSKMKVDRVIRSAVTPEQKETAKRYRELADMLDKEVENPGLWVGPLVFIAVGIAIAILLMALLGSLVS